MVPLSTDDLLQIGFHHIEENFPTRILCIEATPEMVGGIRLHTAVHLLPEGEDKAWTVEIWNWETRDTTSLGDRRGVALPRQVRNRRDVVRLLKTVSDHWETP